MPTSSLCSFSRTPAPGWLLGISHFSPRAKKGAEDPWELTNASIFFFLFFFFFPWNAQRKKTVKIDPELQVLGSNWKKGKVFLVIRGQTVLLPSSPTALTHLLIFTGPSAPRGSQAVGAGRGCLGSQGSSLTGTLIFLLGNYPGDQAALRNSNLSMFLPPVLSQAACLSSPLVLACFFFFSFLVVPF